MKKHLLLLIVLFVGIGKIYAKSIDTDKAMALGQKFVMANFEKSKNNDLQLVKTVFADNGSACYHIFNVGENGFVIISATDNVHPVLAYSEESTFDDSNQSNGVNLMLDTYKESISYAIEKQPVADPIVAAEWKSLENCGKINIGKGGQVGPLCTALWDQNYPYNIYAPECASAGPGGHAYAGCVATAMAMVMYKWQLPMHGTGSHSYTCYGFGELSANFGETNYDWENMVDQLSSNSPDEQIAAVGTLIYHCGIAVETQYDCYGSGALFNNVINAMDNYFGYSHCTEKSRSGYSLEGWTNLLKAEFDLGRPVCYSGKRNTGDGHFFVCDGYNDMNQLHFNFGFSGTNNGWFIADAMEFGASDVKAIINMMPNELYQNTVAAPTNFVVEAQEPSSLNVDVSWKNPTKTVNNTPLTTIDKIIVTRENEVVFTEENVAAGVDMSFDDVVPHFGAFTYKVFAQHDGVNGIPAVTEALISEQCDWLFTLSSNSATGFNGGALVAFDGAENKIYSVTSTSGTTQSFNLPTPIGKVRMAWVSPATPVSMMSITVKNSSNEEIYQFTGCSDSIFAGTLFCDNNSCGNPIPDETPANLYAQNNDDNIIVSWNEVDDAGYGYNVYRDGVLCALTTDNQFVDEETEVGGHCYHVCVIGEGGESNLSNEYCANSGDGCNPATDLSYDVQNNFKPIIKWEIPEDNDGLTGFYINRRTEGGEWEQIKMVGPNKTEYKETKALVDDTWYDYQVVAYYQDIDCHSAPAFDKMTNEFFVHYYYSIDGVDEQSASNVCIYPNPAKNVLTIEAENIDNIMIFNIVGQKLMNLAANSDEVTIDISDLKDGVYILKIDANGNEITRKISVVR